MKGYLRRSQKLIFNRKRLDLQMHRANFLPAIKLALLSDLVQFLNHCFPHSRIISCRLDSIQIRGFDILLQD